MRALLLAVAVLAAAPAAPALLGAQGRIVPRPCPVPQPRPERDVAVPCRPAAGSIERVRHAVRVTLADRVLRYEVHETFVNRGGAVGEADYVFPLPKDAAFQELQLQVGDEMVSGEVLDAGQARRIYESIVRQQRDPALVEWMGHGLLRARIFPIAPGETKRVTVRFATVAEREGDALRVDYAAPEVPAGRRAGDAAADDVGSFILRYDRDAGLGRPYSPTHALEVREQGRWREVLARGGGAVTLLLPVPRASAAAISVLAHRPDADAGFALVTVSPPPRRPATLPRDVTFVIDVSGSMRGEKLEQARAAGRQLVASLEDGDRFRLVAFATDVRHFRDGWTIASRESRRDAERFLDALRADGSTNISGALEEALDVPAARGRLPLVLFLTDGAPTVGERDPARIARRAAELRERARLFTFGVGRDVNAALLEQLALEGRGTAHFVRPEESVERAVGVVAGRLAGPVVTDVRVTVDGVRLDRVHPGGVQDLFAGQDLVLLARYRGAGAGTVRVEGSTPAGPVRWTTNVRFPGRERGNPFVARLWATQRVGWLSAERRRGGPSRELDEEIRMLGLRYGIPTELTSYLVLEPGMRDVAAQNATVRLWRRAAPAAEPRLEAVVTTGASAAPAAPAAQEFEAAKAAAEQRAARSLADLVGAPDAGPSRRRVGERIFTRRGEQWVDERAADSLPTVRIRPYSDAYFSLLQQHPELGAVFALGERVRVAGRAIVVEVAPEAPERLDAGALDRLRRLW